VDRFIAVSGFVRDKYIEAGFPADKIQVMYNAAPFLPEDLSVIKEPERSGITFVGRIAPAKGTRIIKEIIRNIELPINIIGFGPDSQDLKQCCQSYNLCDVKFWGQIPHKDVLKIISSSQCVVVPSVCGEAFPLVAVEAMACGAPVIASNFGGVVELINKSGGGITLDPDTPGAFVEKINELAKHPNSITRIGLAGRQYVKEKLDGKIITDELVAIYQNVIDEKHTRM
jgi:glycosyltransferase involved in cell wall biosynthesis